MNKHPKHRRSPLVSTLIFIVGLSASLIVVALLQFNIGDYKMELAAQLERALQKPVQLGDARLSFDNGIALDVRNLSIGNDEKFSVYVAQMTAVLDPMALLHGQIVIVQIRLDSPRVKLSLPLSRTDSNLNLRRLRLKTLQVRNGSLVVSSPETAASPLRIEHSNLVLQGLGRGLVSELTATATLFQNDRDAELKTSISLTRTQQNQPWRQAQLRGNLSLNGLRNKTLERWKLKLPHSYDLTMNLEGIPARQVELDAKLKDSSSHKTLLTLSAQWRSQAAKDSLSNLKLGLAGIPLHGELRLDRRQQKPVLSGKIKLKETRLSTLLTAYPDHPLKGLGGRIIKLEAVFSGPLHATAENPLSPLQSAQLNLDNLFYAKGDLALEAGSLEVSLKDGRLSRIAGAGRLATIPFTLQAESGPLFVDGAKFSLELEANPDLAMLLKKTRSSFWKKQHVSGIIPVKLKLNGSADNLRVQTTANLDTTRLVIAKLLDKRPTQPLRLSLDARLLPERIQITQARIGISGADLIARGELGRQEKLWNGTIKLDKFETSELQSYSPIFDFFEIAGQASGQIELNQKSNLRLNLSNGAAQLTSLLGRLNQAEGEVRFDRNGIDFGTLQAKLGASAVKISGAMQSWRAPVFDLRMTGKEMRAQDLIFTNRTMKLQNVDARLLINRGGITFSAIDLTVANHSRIRVEGQMRSYHNPQIYLEARSDDADILDIIRLFSGPRPQPTENTVHNKATLELRAQAAKGHLGSFYFENARGTIHDRDNIFTLYPLNLQLGKGKVSGRVEFDRKRDNLLKISGSAESCDADRVYTMLFERKGIFKGTLSGNFYLQGEGVGEPFWRTVHGGAHLRIHDGAMRKLKGLARIFSLLNVSQLFKFRLPDMDKEGLPFSLLESSMSVNEGFLTYDDFRITSPAINISAVGKIDILQQTIDSTVGIKPLRTVDIILSRVPLFGWVLTGEEEALITALFNLKGKLDDPEVSAAPASSVARTALGIIGRTLGLPLHMLQKTGEFLTTPPQPKAPPDSAPAQPQK